MNADFHKSPTTHVLAFSKGCVVVNQMLVELATVFQQKKSQKGILKWMTPEAKKYCYPLYHVDISNSDSDETFYFLKQNAEAVKRFFDTVKVIHYLDCHRFPTTEEVIKLVCEYCNMRDGDMQIFVHASPCLYKETSMYRKHIKPECDTFVGYITKYHKKQNKQEKVFKLYFEKKEGLQQHFNIMRVFNETGF